MDSNYRFVWASLDTPGNTHDSTFQSTTLWSNIVSGGVLSEAVAKTNDDIVIPLLILGDREFIWNLIKSLFNQKLQGRWPILSRKCES